MPNTNIARQAEMPGCDPKITPFPKDFLLG
jgi:hypothetical protein